MATNNLEVKFKVDASEVTRGSDEAKRKVKNAADSMAASMREVSNATKDASSAVRQMEGQVASSSRSMERDLSKVARQMSAMQMFNLGARGVGLLGGVASNIAKYNGNYDAASTIDSTTKVAQGGMQGAAMGFAAAGPVGAAVGALMGAGNALLEAAVMQKEAARAMLNGSVKSIEDIEDRYQSRTRQEEIARQASAANFDSTAAAQQIAEAKQAVEDAKNRQADIQDILYGRKAGIIDIGSLGGYGRGVATQEMQGNWMDPSFRQRVTKNIEDAIHGQSGTLGGEFNRLVGPNVETFVADQYKIFADEAKNAEEEVQRAQKRLQELAPLQARIDAEQSKIAQMWLNSQEEFWNSGAGRAFDDYQNGKDLEDEKREKERTLADYQRQLQGVISRPAETPTDALTRIGGGRGYAAYNNSTAQIQKNIENYLKTLISNQKSQIQEIIDELRTLKGPTEMVWANP